MRTILMTALLAASACSPEPPKSPPAPAAPAVKAIDAVIAAERAFAADGASAGWVEAFEKWMTPDATVLQPGPTSAKAFYAGIDPANRGDTSLKWGPEFAGVSKAGDIGFTTGPYNGDGAAFGYYFTVWRKQADGNWRWIFDEGTNIADPTIVPAADAPVKTVLPTGLGGPASAAKISVERLELAIGQNAAVDVAATFAGQLANDVRMHRDEQKPAIGLEAVTAALAAGPKQVAYTPLRIEIASSGDFAFTLGEAAWKGGEGYYNRIWMHEPKGWRIVFDQIIPRDVPAK